MYKINKGLKEWHIDINSFIIEFQKKCNIFNIIPNNVKFYSQQDEDKYIIQYLLKEKITNGTYLEIGACDGKLYSNTKTLEDFFGFQGILIEPQKHFFEKIQYNRCQSKNELYNCAITNEDCETILFCGNNPMGGIYSDTNTDIKLYDWKPYEVKNHKMNYILKNSKFESIDFMIIDVEVSELSLLKSIDLIFQYFVLLLKH